VHVRLYRRQQLWLQQHSGQAQPVHRVALHDLDHRAGEELPDVSQPSGHTRRRLAQAAGAGLRLGRFALVQRAQRIVHCLVLAGQGDAGGVVLVVVGRAAEHHSPAA